MDVVRESRAQLSRQLELPCSFPVGLVPSADVAYRPRGRLLDLLRGRVALHRELQVLQQPPLPRVVLDAPHVAPADVLQGSAGGALDAFFVAVGPEALLQIYKERQSPLLLCLLVVAVQG